MYHNGADETASPQLSKTGLVTQAYTDTQQCYLCLLVRTQRLCVFVDVRMHGFSGECACVSACASVCICVLLCHCVIVSLCHCVCVSVSVRMSCVFCVICDMYAVHVTCVMYAVYHGLCCPVLSCMYVCMSCVCSSQIMCVCHVHVPVHVQVHDMSKSTS